MVTNMYKFPTAVLLLFFILGSFIASINTVSAYMVQEELPDFWSEMAPMTKARAGLGVVAVVDKVYAIGGYTDYNHILDTNEQYDPGTDTWSTLKAMPTPRHSFAIAANPDKIYCIGGETYKDGLWFKSDLNEVYNIATNTWSTKTPLPVNGSNIQAHAFWGEIYVISDNTLFAYNPVTDVWTTKTSIPISPASPTLGFVSAVVGNKIIVTCHSLSGNSIEQKVAMYDIPKDEWSEGKTSPKLIGDGFAAEAILGLQGGISIPERMHVFLGDSETLSYDPAEDTWTSSKGMPTDRKNFGIAATSSAFYIIGGYSPDTQKVCTINEQYTPIKYATVSVDPNPAPLIFLIATIPIVCVTVIVLFLHFRKKRASKKMKTKNTIPSA